MRVELSQQHINDGIRRSCRQCAVALAVESKLGKAVKVTSQFVHVGRYHWDDISLGEERIAKVGKKLRFFINDFDTEPKAVKPVTLELAAEVLEIVGDYAPIESYLIHHVNHPQILGPCGCIECEFGKDAFTEAERAKMEVFDGRKPSEAKSVENSGEDQSV